MTGFTHFDFVSVTSDTLSGVMMLPDGSPKGIIQLVHGMCEYIERYEDFARILAADGWIVVGHTCLGHGRNAKRLGYFADKDGWQCLIDDVHALRSRIQLEYPNLPYIMFGHSMGTFVVRCYLTEHAAGLTGVVLSGTGYYNVPLVLGGLTIANLLCLLGQKKKPSPLINAIGFSSANKPFAPNRTPFDWLTSIDSEVDKYIRDPYCGFLFTTSGYRDLFRGLWRLTKEKKLRSVPSDLPVLFVSGAQDPIGAQGIGVERVAEGFRKNGCGNVTVRLYPGGRHEMFREVGKEAFFSDIINALNGMIKK